MSNDTDQNNSASIMGVIEIREYLSHRYPFLLVDKVTKLIKGESISAIKNVTINEPFFNGHFPAQPIMPGVLIIEAMAQATGLLGFKTISDTPSPKLLFVLAGVDKVRFYKPLKPGDRFDIFVKIDRIAMGIANASVKGSVDSEIVSECKITYKIISEKENS